MEHIEVLESIEDMLKDGCIKMYLIMKKNGSDIEKSRGSQYIEITSEPLNFFKNNFIQKVSQLKKVKDFRDFITITDQPNYQECCPFVYKTEDIRALTPLLKEINNSQYGARAFLNNKNVKNVYGFAIEITKVDKGRAIYFKKYTPKNILKSTASTFVFTRGTFDLLRGDVFNFDNVVDSIYYELEATKDKKELIVLSNGLLTEGLQSSSDTSENSSTYIGNKGIYVLNLPDFEDLFAVEELYKEKSKIALDTMLKTGIVDIKKEVFDSCIEKKSMSKKLSKLLENGELTKERLDEIKQACIKYPNKFAFSVIGEKIKADTEEGFNHLIEVFNKNILRDLLTDDLYIARNVKAFPKNKITVV